MFVILKTACFTVRAVSQCGAIVQKKITKLLADPSHFQQTMLGRENGFVYYYFSLVFHGLC